MAESNNGTPPGVVRVPSGTRFRVANGATNPGSMHEEPQTSSGPGAPIGPGNGGDAPGVVRVSSTTQGSHPRYHAGTPGSGHKQGHTSKP